MRNLILSIRLVLLIFLTTCVIIDNINKTRKENTTRLTDSLNLIIKNKDSIINTFKQDTIIHTKYITLIKTKYDTIYKDFSNSSIVSDDSITNYISNKIHN